MTRRSGALRSLARSARRALPFAVSGALLVLLFRRFDVASALDAVDGAALFRLAATLVVFSVASLALEAVCLARVVGVSRGRLSTLDAGRIKAASYLLSLLNYALGAAALSVLLRRRAGVSLARSAGMVFLISLLDVLSLLACAALGAALFEGDRPLLRAGLVPALIALAVAGLALLRAPVSLGPLERLRMSPLFTAARTASPRLLVELAGLRVAFVGSLVALLAGALWAFGVDVPTSSLLLNTPIVLAVSALPIAAAGLGTAQVALIELFGRWAPAETLLAASLSLSAGIIVIRSGLGLLFAGEFSREALAAVREPRGPVDDPSS